MLVIQGRWSEIVAAGPGFLRRVGGYLPLARGGQKLAALVCGDCKDAMVAQASRR
jgi:hypothetical protein